VQQGVPPSGSVRRGGPGMPLERPDPDGDDSSRSAGILRRRRFRRTAPRLAQYSWWRPSSVLGRTFLGLGALIVLAAWPQAYSFSRPTWSATRAFALQYSNIEATGLTEVSRAEMLPVFGEDIGATSSLFPYPSGAGTWKRFPGWNGPR